MSKSLFSRAFDLLRSGDPSSVDEALLMLRKEVDSKPGDMKALFEYAGAFDFLGRESDALAQYLKIFEKGHQALPPEDQPRLYVQLGSTLRNVGSLPESKRILLEGLSHFPKNQALRAFLALTEHSLGNHAESTRLLMEVVLEPQKDAMMLDYARALGWYAGKLR